MLFAVSLHRTIVKLAERTSLMRRSVERILTTHIGSIPRPAELLELAKTEDAPGSPDTFPARLEALTVEIVRRQVAAGLDIVNDGEFGKDSWANYIMRRITGFELRPDRMRPIEWLGSDRVRFADFMRENFPRAVDGVPTQVCTGPIVYSDRRPLERAINNLRAGLAASKAQEGFMTAVAPASTAYDGVNEFYRGDSEYVFAIAEALREEYLAIHAAGLLLQVDDALLANMYDHLVHQSPARYREWAALRVQALNHALRGIPPDRIRYHVCFGSWHVPHVSDAPLEEIIDLILEVNAGAYALEAANPRHEHEWRVWERVKLREGQILIPGVVTHHTTSVEHPRLVADRIVRYAKLVGRENVIAGTDCGFAQSDVIQRVHPSVMWAKFDALVQGAKLASDELWGRSCHRS